MFEGIPGPFWALLVGTFITRAGSFVVSLLFIYLTRVRGLSLTQAGGVVALFGAGSLLGSLSGGVLADRWGRKRTMLAALLLGAVWMLILGSARELLALAAATFCFGLSADAYRPASQALVADLVPEAYRRKAFGMQYWAINLGFSVASILGGFLAQRDFGLLFYGDAATTLVLAAMIWRWIPETRPKEKNREKQGNALTPFLDHRFFPFLILNFVMALIFFQHLSSLPDLMRSRGIPLWHYGWVMAANGIAIITLQPILLAWTKRWKAEKVLAYAFAFYGIGFGVTQFAANSWIFALTVLIWTLGEIVASPASAAVVAELSPRLLRGRYQAAFMIVWGLAAMSAPVVGSLVIARLGHPALWTGCAVVGFGAAGWLTVRRYLLQPKG